MAAGHLIDLGQCRHGSRELRYRRLGAPAPFHVLTNARLAVCAMVAA
jgi:hypothetical protein